MSAGLYALPAGGIDPQHPHAEDEIYYVIHGKASIQIDGKDTAVGEGSVIYVPAGVEHRFHTITDDLQVLVCFAPAESAPNG